MMLSRVKKSLSDITRDVLINTVASSVLVHPRIRCFLYKLYGMKVETNAIRSRCFFGGNNIHISKGTYINYECFFDNTEKITIGNSCNIGMRTVFITSLHNIGGPDRRALETYGKPILVGNGTWIGTNVTVLPGVTISEGCIIAAGATVTEDCNPNGLYAGVPARRVKDLNDEFEVIEKANHNIHVS